MNTIYNRLNLPDSVSFPLQGNTMKLEYLADGRRVRTTAKTYGTPLVFPGGGSTPQNPVNILEEVRDGELVFRDGQLVELRTDGGWFSMWNDTLSTTQVRPYFYVMDYLGSVRMTVDGVTGDVEQSLEYLPSGYVFRSDNYAEQPYKFCGKELITMHGWDMYDSFARYQYARLPRFSTMDPLAEWDYATSPYAYCQNDFVNLADPTGMSPVYDIHGKFLGTTKEGFTGMVLIYSGNTNVPWHELSEDFVYNYLYDYVSSFDFAVQTNMIDDRGMVKVWNHILSRFEGLGVMGQTFRMSSLVGEGLSYEKRYDFTWFTKGHGYGNIEIYGTGYQPGYEYTVEDIASSVIVHEWYSHMITKTANGNNHRVAYQNVINYNPFWNNTTLKYRGFVLRKLLLFTSKETGRYMVSPPYFEDYWKYCIY